MDLEQQRRSRARWDKYAWKPPQYCRSGHELNEENLWVQPEKHKWECRVCNREKKRRHRESEDRREVERVAIAIARQAGEKQLAERDWRLRRTFGITLAQFDAMAEAQGNRCAMCGRIPKRRRMTTHGVPWTGLVVDHCHDTGRIRGLLCVVCNQGMGFADRIGLDRIAAYQSPERHE